ncbi:1022_t:CDS:2 [Scutellospora calospora]|uniref:1022_t:CDS:1 n=1 Tax=Scutellospora calospora TaxID=85575 RepID=A0ACA9JWJ4_9GLOM|nr:1022_t:CDS:2 [Scutellospora calospora]
MENISTKHMKGSIYIPSDIIEEILYFIQNELTDKTDYLNNESFALFNCLLVNRQWCRLVIPRLWRQPFLYVRKGNPKLISTFLIFLNDNKRRGLQSDGIIFSSLRSLKHRNFYVHKSQYQSLFNYPSFLKHLHYDYMLSSIEGWCTYSNQSSGNAISLITNSLLTLFVDNNVKLTSLFVWPNHIHWNHYSSNRYMELVEPEFIGLLSELKNLHIETHSKYPSSRFFSKLSRIVNVKNLYLRTQQLGLMGFPNDLENEMARNISILINEQTNLITFTLSNSIRYTSDFIKSLSSNVNNLQNISLIETKLNENESWTILSKCINLRKLEIIKCFGLNLDSLMLFLSNSWTNLKTINIENNHPIDANSELELWANKKRNKII